jgi:hypothetical protein
MANPTGVAGSAGALSLARHQPALEVLHALGQAGSTSQKWGHYRLTEADRTIMLNAILSNPEVWPEIASDPSYWKEKFISMIEI